MADEIDVKSVESFFGTLTLWVNKPFVKSFLMEWKKRDSVTHRVMFNLGLGGTGTNFDKMWAEVRTKLQVFNRDTIPQLASECGASQTKDFVSIMNSTFTDNASFLHDSLIVDRSLIATRISYEVGQNPSILEPKHKDGSVIKSLTYVLYLAFPIGVVYNLSHMGMTSFTSLVDNPNLAEALFSCRDIRKRILRLRKIVYMKFRKKDDKFRNFLDSFEDVDSQRLFLSFSTLVRGIIQQHG
jgi:hypothetical protein